VVIDLIGKIDYSNAVDRCVKRFAARPITAPAAQLVPSCNDAIVEIEPGWPARRVPTGHVLLQHADGRQPHGIPGRLLRVPAPRSAQGTAFPRVRLDAQAGQRLKRVGRSLVGCQRGFEGDFATTMLGVEVVVLAATDDARDTAVGSKDGTARVAFESVQIGDEVVELARARVANHDARAHLEWDAAWKAEGDERFAKVERHGDTRKSRGLAWIGHGAIEPDEAMVERALGARNFEADDLPAR
jgi:hypothetical protein